MGRIARHPPPRRIVAWAALFVMAATVLAGAGCGGSDDDGLTVYSGRIAPLVGPLIDEIEARENTDIQTRFGETPQLASTILEEGENSPADVFFSQDAGALGALDREGLLMPLPRDIIERVPPRFRAEDGNWVGTSARSRVIAYSEDVARAELPDSVLGLTDPKWRGRVGWAPTNGSFEAFVTAMRETLGEDRAREWLEGMVANDVQAYDSNVPIRDAIAAGEIDVGLINHYYVAQAVAEEGPDYPVRIYFPRGDLGSMVNVAGVGILKSTDQPEEALRFVREMLAPDSQRFFAESSYEYPVTPGIPALPSLVPLARIPDPGVDLSDLTDLEGTLELLQETGAL
jgi:iron(III) transport system substrate-binding protein